MNIDKNIINKKRGLFYSLTWHFWHVLKDLILRQVRNMNGMKARKFSIREINLGRFS